MNDLDVVQFVQKTLKGRKAQIQELMSEGGIKDMEHYKQLVGNVEALQMVEDRINEILSRLESDE